MTQDDNKWLKKTCKMTLMIKLTWLTQVTQYNLTWLWMTKNDLKWLKMTYYDLKWLKTTLQNKS